MRSRNIVIATLFAVLAAVYLVLTQAGTEGVERFNPVETPTSSYADRLQAARALVARVNSKAAQHSEVPRQGPVFSGPLLDLYNSGSGWRAASLYAAQHPEFGGAFYAERMMTFCRGVARGTEVLDTIQLAFESDADSIQYGRRMESATQLKTRCGDFLTTEHGFDRERDVFAAGAKAMDPLIQATQAVRAAREIKGDVARASTALPPVPI